MNNGLPSFTSTHCRQQRREHRVHNWSPILEGLWGKSKKIEKKILSQGQSYSSCCFSYGSTRQKPIGFLWAVFNSSILTPPPHSTNSPSVWWLFALRLLNFLAWCILPLCPWYLKWGFAIQLRIDALAIWKIKFQLLRIAFCHGCTFIFFCCWCINTLHARWYSQR